MSNNVHEIGYTDGGDSPAWAAAKASARDVMENAARKYDPFRMPMAVLEDSIHQPFAESLERAIAEALFKAWQK